MSVDLTSLGLPADIPKFLAPGQQAAPPAAAPSTLKQREKAAIIVRLLLSDGRKLRLVDLPGHVQKQLARDVGSIRQIDQVTLNSVVEEFIAELESGGVSFGGGLHEALSILDGSISGSTAQDLSREEGVELTSDPWRRLVEVDADLLQPLVENESTEVAAVLMSKLEVGKAAELLGRISGERARRIAFAVSLTSAVSPQAVRTIGRALLAQIDDVPARAFSSSPVDRVGAILNNAGSSTRETVLAGLEEENTEFADRVRKAIFTFANIPERIRPRDIPKITRLVDATALAQALKSAEETAPEAAEFILANISKRMAEQIAEEKADMAAPKPKEAEAAMDAVTGAIRTLVDEGEMEFFFPDDE